MPPEAHHRNLASEFGFVLQQVMDEPLWSHVVVFEAPTSPIGLIAPYTAAGSVCPDDLLGGHDQPLKTGEVA